MAIAATVLARRPLARVVAVALAFAASLAWSTLALFSVVNLA